jgi:hypothetical protein
MSLSNQPRLRWFLWSVLMWLLLAVCCFVLIRERCESAFGLLSLGLAPTIAVYCGLRSLLLAKSQVLLIRIGWWSLTILVGGLTGIFFQGQWEARFSTDSEGWLMVITIVPSLALIGMLLRMHRKGPFSWRGWTDVVAAFGFVALLIWAGFSLLNARVSNVEKDATKRWALLGRPLAEFEKKVMRVEENRSLRELLEDVRPLGVFSLYKTSVSGESDYGPELAPEIMQIINSETPPSDSVELGAIQTPWLDQHREALNRIYERILMREPAVWTFDPENIPLVRVPNFLVLRKLSQTFFADSLHRIQCGDAVGARSAVQAGLKMTEGLRESPLLVSLMIRVAIEAMFTRSQVRLAAEFDSSQNVSAHISEMREAFRHTIQFEGWGWSWFANNPTSGFNLNECTKGYLCFGKWPEWLKAVLVRPCMRYDSALASIVDAEATRISLRPSLYLEPDLGAREIEDLNRRYPSTLAPNCQRSWHRIQVTLLLQEQVSLIQNARAKLSKGLKEEIYEMSSSVVAGAHWTVKLDTMNRSVALLLNPTPQWVNDPAIVGDGFWCLPHDGSKKWKLSVQKTTADLR